LKKTKKELVFEAAGKLFMEKGYLAASMRELAERVGLEQASSLYSHLKKKEEVLQKICFDNAYKFIDGISEIEKKGISASEKVRQLIALHIRVAIDDFTSVTVFNDEWRHLSEPFLSDFLTLRRDYENRFKKIIDDGISAGEFKKTHSIVALYTILTSVRWIHYWYNEERDLSLEELEKDISGLLLTGLIKD
jgi:TetR/AcrR family transcriptional regulator, cholesterol catabolism regulator